jgi:hypothetical protein
VSNPTILVQYLPVELALANDVEGIGKALDLARHVAVGGAAEECAGCGTCGEAWSPTRQPACFVLLKQVDPPIAGGLFFMICDGCNSEAESSKTLLGTFKHGLAKFTPLQSGGRA